MRQFPVCFVSLLIVMGCPQPDPFVDDDISGDDDAAGDDDAVDDDSTPADLCDDYPGAIICDGDTEVVCDAAGDMVSTQLCDAASGFDCWWGYGCMKCYPDTAWCEGNVVVACTSDGQDDQVVEICDEAAGEVCSGGECITLCSQAEQQRASIGCKFYGVDMEQYPGYQGLQYAIVVSNVHETLTAHVVVERKSAGVWTWVSQADVLPQDLAIFQLSDQQTTGTSVRIGGAYRVTSTIPVIAYQFNPLDNGSYTSDASMLLPASAFDTVYLTTAWGSVPPGFTYDSSLLNVVAETDGTEVYITPSVNTAAGTGIPAGQAGVTFGPIVLDEGDVLQVINDTNSAHAQSMEGTLVDASSRVAVYGGHYCANVPTTACCCDHIEEMVFGLQTWGTQYVGARMPARANPPEVVYWHFLGGDQPATLSFVASAGVTGLPPGNTLSLAAGEVRELMIAGTMGQPGDFVVSSDEAFLATQYMAGDDHDPNVTTGDPCMVQAVPVEQYLDNYVVLVPNSWDPDYLTIARTPGEAVIVDGIHVEAWPGWAETATINPDWEVIRLDVEDGTHVLEGSAPFGVIVSGADSYDSYCYPGGLNQQIINDV